MNKKKPRKPPNKALYYPKSTLVNPKYGLPITKTKEITQTHIEAICERIEKGNFLESACTLENVDFEAFHILMNIRTGNPLSQYAEFAVKQAQAKQEDMFIQQMLNPQNCNNANIKALSDFLTIVNPKFNRKYKTQMEYELYILLDMVKNVVSPEQYLKILDMMRSTDSKEIVASIDSKLAY
jgi:hypothetical protein